MLYDHFERDFEGESATEEREYELRRKVFQKTGLQLLYLGSAFSRLNQLIMRAISLNSMKEYNIYPL